MASHHKAQPFELACVSLPFRASLYVACLHESSSPELARTRLGLFSKLGLLAFLALEYSRVTPFCIWWNYSLPTFEEFFEFSVSFNGLRIFRVSFFFNEQVNIQ